MIIKFKIRRPKATPRYLASFDHFIGFLFIRTATVLASLSAILRVRNQSVARLSYLCRRVVAIFEMWLFDKNRESSANSATPAETGIYVYGEERRGKGERTKMTYRTIYLRPALVNVLFYVRAVQLTIFPCVGKKTEK